MNPAATRAGGRRGFTLMEVLVATMMTAVLLVCVLTGTISLQHAYASTEEYSAGQADQARLLDYLALDLRRGVQLSGNANCYVVDPDGQGLKITVPDLYRFATNDTQHLFPVLVTPIYDATTGTAYYNGSNAKVASGGPYPSKVITYRFNAADGSVLRTDPWAPLLAGSKGLSQAAPTVIASNLEAFPRIIPDASDIAGNTVRYGVSFHSTFRTGSTTQDGTDITLHHVTFIRSKNLAH